MTQNEFAIELGRKYGFSVSTVVNAINQAITQLKQVKDIESITGQQVAQEAERIISAKAVKKQKTNAKYYLFPLTKAFSWLFEQEMQKVTSIPGYNFVEYKEDGITITYNTANDMEIIENPLNVTRWKWYYIAICSLFGTKGSKVSITQQDLYRAVSNHKGKVKAQAFKAFISDLQEFYNVINKVKVKIQEHTYTALKMTFNGDNIEIQIPALLDHARKQKRIAGIKAQFIGSGKVESIPQRAYLALRIHLAKNKNNTMCKKVKSDTIKRIAGNDSFKVTKKYFEQMKDKGYITQYVPNLRCQDYAIQWK